jgi:hypothetical protein
MFRPHQALRSAFVAGAVALAALLGVSGPAKAGSDQIQAIQVTSCDSAAPVTQDGFTYLTVDAHGAVCVVGTGAGGGIAAVVTATAGGFADGAITTVGTEADAACATDNGTCTLEALTKRLNQRVSSAITALGTPFQAGGSIGNTAFGATESGTWNVGLSAGTNNVGVFGYAQGAAIAGQVGQLAMCEALAAAPTYTTAQTYPLTCTLGGALSVTEASSAPAPPNDVLQTCTATSGAHTPCIVSSQGSGGATVVITGTGTGMSALIEGSTDGTNYTPLNAFTPSGVAVPSSTAITANGSWIVGAGGWRDIEVVWSAITGGTATVSLNSSAGSVQPFFGPAGGNTVEGPTATSAAFVANPLPGGGEASSAEPTKQTTGHPAPDFRDLVGKEVTSPYANRENLVRGGTSETGTSAGTILAASGSASLKEYLTDIECSNTSATTTTVTLNDTSSLVLIVPAGLGYSHTFNVPLVAAANTAMTFTATAGETTIYCYGQGFNGY